MPTTILEILETTARAHADRPAMARKRAGAWETITWREYREAVRRAARALVATGVEPGQGVVILAQNRPEWFIANLASIAAGARPAGIYTNSTPEQCRYITEHAGAVVAVVENRETLEVLLSGGAAPSGLKAIVLMDGDATGRGVVTWADFLARGDEAPDAEVARRTAAAQTDDVATLIYTSGTTGKPKGVMLTQGNLLLHRGDGAQGPARRGHGPPHQLPAPLAHRRAGRLAPALARLRGVRPLRGEPREAAREPARGAPAPLPGRARGCGRRSRPGCRPRAPRRARCSGGIAALGPGDRPRGRLRRPGGPAPALELPPRRPPRLLEGPRAARLRPDPHARRLRRADREGDPRLLPEPRPADHGGLRHERVHRADDDVAARALSPRARGLRASRHRAADRRGRRDPHARAARLQGVLQERRGDAGDARRAKGGSTPATWARSTRTASCA